ncbi:MAG TPA: YlxR family protein, partial [Polyangiaceae bacterium]|nr:YlxR family protein [Polyangiaceae bacterium]
MQRSCVGCRSPVDPGELVRLVLGPEGEVVVDLARGAFGRGAWVHPRPECIEKAAPQGLSRAFKCQVRDNGTQVLATFRAAAERRVQGLVLAARRAHKLEAGASAVEEAVRARRAALVLVATDARASADLAWLAPLVANGQALAFSTKATFA